MEAALALTRGVPRAYLLPSPQQRQTDAQLTFRPQITQKSKVSIWNSAMIRLAIVWYSAGCLFFYQVGMTLQLSIAMVQLL